MADNINSQPNQAEENISEVIQIRRDKLAAMKESGNDPYVNVKYDVDAYSSDIINNFDKYEGKTVSIAGRMMSRRIMGKASFMHIQDG